MDSNKMNIKAEIKSHIVASGKTMKDVNAALCDAKGSNTSPQNLSNKLTIETLTYADAKRIADICGYEIIWKKKD